MLTHLLACTLTNQHTGTLLTQLTACLDLQALRNEDDYQKFAGDSNRSHVTVSSSSHTESDAAVYSEQLCWLLQLCHCAVLLWKSAVMQLFVLHKLEQQQSTS